MNLRSSIAAITLAILPSAPASNAVTASDPYGGFTGITREATGFFRIERIGNRQFFITPQGHPYLPIGANHLGSYFQPDRAVGTTNAPNLVATRHEGDKEEAVRHIVSLLREWGFNYAGYDAPWEFRDKMPFSTGFYPVKASAVVQEGFAFEDVFDPAFARDLDRRVAEATRPYRDNPFLVGYYLADLPLWGRRADLSRDERQRGASWISFFRGLPADAPGKRVYLDFLAERYTDREKDFRDIYPIAQVDSGEAVEIDFSRVDPDQSAPDDEAFQGLIADRLYALTLEAFARHAPNHLVLGERFAGYRADFLPVLEAASRHFPVVAIQKTGEFDRAFHEEIYRLSGRPVISVDHVFSFPTRTILRTRGHQVGSEAEAAELYRRYLTEAMAQPWFVGYHRCQLVDRVRIPGDPPAFKQGLIRSDGSPYELLTRAIRETNEEVRRLLEAELQGAE